jgi:hypothetical protein
VLTAPCACTRPLLSADSLAFPSRSSSRPASVCVPRCRHLMHMSISDSFFRFLSDVVNRHQAIISFSLLRGLLRLSLLEVCMHGCRGFSSSEAGCYVCVLSGVRDRFSKGMMLSPHASMHGRPAVSSIGRRGSVPCIGWGPAGCVLSASPFIFRHCFFVPAHSRQVFYRTLILSSFRITGTLIHTLLCFSLENRPVAPLVALCYRRGDDYRAQVLIKFQLF